MLVFNDRINSEESHNIVQYDEALTHKEFLEECLARSRRAYSNPGMNGIVFESIGKLKPQLRTEIHIEVEKFGLAK